MGNRYKRSSAPQAERPGRLTAAMVAALVIPGMLYAALYWSVGSGPALIRIPCYNPTMFSFLVLSTAVAAFLALGRHQVLQDSISFWVGLAFAAFSIGLTFYVLSWPGILPEDRSVIGQLPNTSGVLSVLAPLIPGIAFLLAATVHFPRRNVFSGRRWIWNTGLSLLLVIVLYILVFKYEDSLPRFIEADGSFTSSLVLWNFVLMLVYTTGIMLSARRYIKSGDTLIRYVFMFQCAIAYSALGNLLGGQRYDLWWYLNRAILVSFAFAVLTGLLIEYVKLLGSEREYAKRVLASKEDLDRAQAVAHTGSWRMDAKNKRLDWSAETYRIFGIPAGTSMTYDAFLSAVHPDDKEAVDEKWQAALQGKPYDVEHRIVVGNQERWVHEKAQLELDERGAVTGGFGTVQDITDTKKTQDALSRSESILSQAGRMVNLGAWEIDIHNLENLNLNPLTWSDQTYRIFGYEPGSVSVTNDLFFEHVHPDDRPKIVEAVALSMKNHSPYTIEHRIIRADGTQRVVLEYADTLFNERGRPVRLIGAVQDITERKEAEQREMELERQQMEFYRRTILAATKQKLVISDRASVEEVLGPACASWPIEETRQLAPLRRHVIDIARRNGLSGEALQGLETCVSEAASNAIKHAGGGNASLHIHNDKFLFAVSDNGAGIPNLNIPDVALVMGFSTVGTGGMGYKLMIAFADKVYLATGSEGTIVAVEFGIPVADGKAAKHDGESVGSGVTS